MLVCIHTYFLEEDTLKRREKTEFGDFLVSLIREANMSQEEFYLAVGIAKPYFYDLLTASPPPKGIQDKMIFVLDGKIGMDAERKAKFYDLAAVERKEIPADIAKLIVDNPQKLKEVRLGLAKILFAQQ